MAQTITDFKSFLEDAKEAVTELSDFTKKEEQLKMEELRLEKSLEAEQKAVQDAISMTVKKRREERVGAMCLENGKPSIVEYYELTPEMAEAKNENGSLQYGFGVILNYLFRVDKLMAIAEKSLPLHVVEKKVPYIDENGTEHKPETPNAYKFETLILDMVYMMDNSLPFEVDREKEFAPVKNATGTDSVETARALLEKNGIEI